MVIGPSDVVASNIEKWLPTKKMAAGSGRRVVVWMWQETIELIKGGLDIGVTNGNKIHYIHLMADYRLNKQANHFAKTL